MKMSSFQQQKTNSKNHSSTPPFKKKGTSFIKTIPEVSLDIELTRQKLYINYLKYSQELKETIEK